MEGDLPACFYWLFILALLLPWSPINIDYVCCYYQFLFVVMEWEIIVQSNMDKKQKQNFKTFLQPIQSFFLFIHL